jgi:hypothetical protein
VQEFSPLPLFLFPSFLFLTPMGALFLPFVLPPRQLSHQAGGALAFRFAGLGNHGRRSAAGPPPS